MDFWLQNILMIDFEYLFFFQEYKLLFEGAGSNPGDKTLEDRFFEHEVSISFDSVKENVIALYHKCIQWFHDSVLMWKHALFVFRWNLISWPSWTSFISACSMLMSS